MKSQSDGKTSAGKGRGSTEARQEGQSRKKWATNASKGDKGQPEAQNPVGKELPDESTLQQHTASSAGWKASWEWPGCRYQQQGTGPTAQPYSRQQPFMPSAQYGGRSARSAASCSCEMKPPGLERRWGLVVGAAWLPSGRCQAMSASPFL
jgi:hypothetical protein